MKNILLLSFILTCLGGYSQSKQIKSEGILTSKKWMCMDVSRKKLEKMDFKLEMGNELRFTIDKKYQFENNEYNYSAGTWKLDGKYLYFIFVDPKGDNKKIITQYQVKKLKEDQLVLKRITRPGGKLTFK